MRCQSCQQNPATVHQVVAEYGPDGNQEIREIHLCGACARADGVPVPAAPAFPAMIGMLGKALLSQAAATTDPSTACPACGWTLRDFRQTSRFGCPEDYEFLGSMLRRSSSRFMDRRNILFHKRMRKAPTSATRSRTPSSGRITRKPPVSATTWKNWIPPWKTRGLWIN